MLVTVPKVLLPEDISDLDGLPQIDNSKGTPLKLNHTLVSCTLVILEDIIVDACLEEEDLSTSSITVTISSIVNDEN